MAEIGYFLSSEEHGPAELVRQAQLAEQAGFTGPGYLAAMAVVAVVAVAILIWRVLRLRA